MNTDAATNKKCSQVTGYCYYYLKILLFQDGQKFENKEPNEVVGNDKGGKCLVNVGPGGHEAHFVAFFKGDFQNCAFSICI